MITANRKDCIKKIMSNPPVVLYGEFWCSMSYVCLYIFKDPMFTVISNFSLVAGNCNCCKYQQQVFIMRKISSKGYTIKNHGRGFSSITIHGSSLSEAQLFLKIKMRLPWKPQSWRQGWARPTKNIVNFIFLQKSIKKKLKVYERGVEKPAKIQTFSTG